MIKNSTAKMTKLRRGTQDLLERRGMAASTARRSPELHLAGVLARRTGTAEPPAHGGRHLDATATAGAAPSLHAELRGHRHRGAEKHSAH